ncbi:unnamed protein product [Rhizoctonia solani]|uniref:Protein kinase domain-containing protein n=1 Tax=Rhizoctonia solani TaxID=456999 RepID=A0A8H2XKV5_9AGAM|nr:unnamed protein product [Rhizoctonia solani]
MGGRADLRMIRVNAGTPPHRFVLTCLEDGTVYRFDRSLESLEPAVLLLEAVGGVSSRRAKDELQAVSKGQLLEIEASTQCEVDITLPPNIDLSLVISACFSISRDSEGRHYDLLRYNSYFFSWAIVLIVGRYAFPLRALLPEDLSKWLRPRLNGLADSFAVNTVKVLESIFIDFTKAIWHKAGAKLRTGMSFADRLAWHSQTSAVCLTFRRLLNIPQYPGLRDRLYIEMLVHFRQHEEDLLNTLCTERAEINRRLNQQLWVDSPDLGGFNPQLQQRLIKIIWSLILDTIVAVEVEDELLQKSRQGSRTKNIIFGDIQWTQIWNNALKMGLKEARDAAKESLQSSTTGMHHGEIFGVTFKAASQPALSGAKMAMNRVGAGPQVIKRAEEWQTIWTVWDEAWRIAGEATRAKVVQLVENGVEIIAALVQDRVVATIEHEDTLEPQVTVNDPNRHDTLRSFGDLQSHILRCMHSSYRAIPDYTRVMSDALQRVWENSQTIHEPLRSANSPGNSNSPEQSKDEKDAIGPIDMLRCLLEHGCDDLSSSIDPDKYSSCRVAEGGFGDIWKGQLHDGTLVAVKVLRWGLMSCKDDERKGFKRMMREIYAWSKLDHENVHKLLGVTLFQGRLGMISKWMAHGNLRDYLSRNPSVDRHKLCVQIAQGLEYIHDSNMVHGDLKASNILISSDNTVKLTDFDYSLISECSLLFSDTTRMGGGTLRWMAPELVLQECSQRSKQTDIYALGMTFLGTHHISHSVKTIFKSWP